MRNFLKLNFVRILFFMVSIMLPYHLLLTDKNALSIASMINYSHHFENTAHLVVLGILPVYIAVMVFGTAYLGLSLGPSLNQLLIFSFKKSRATFKI